MTVTANIFVNTRVATCVKTYVTPQTGPYRSPYLSRQARLGTLAAGAPGPAAAAALPLPLPLGRLAVLALLTVAVILLVVFLLARRAVLRRGGWRRCGRRLLSEVSLTGQAFAEPLRALSRYRQGVSALAATLSDPGTRGLAQRALDAAALVLGDAPGAYPYAVRIGPDEVAVEVAGRRLPLPFPPWWADDTGRGRWRITHDDLHDVPAEPQHVPGRERRRLVAVGVDEGACVFLDLAASPGLVAVEGHGPASRVLLQVLAAQLESTGGGLDGAVTVTRGVHPQYPGPELDEVLDTLEHSGADGAVVVGIVPAPEQARRLGALAETEGALCLVQGRVAGPRWTLRVDHRSQLTAPELGLRADCAPLPRSVARSLKSARRRRPDEAALHPSAPSPQPVPTESQGAAWAPGPMPAEPGSEPAGPTDQRAVDPPPGEFRPRPPANAAADPHVPADGGAGTWGHGEPTTAYGGQQAWEHHEPTTEHDQDQAWEHHEPTTEHGQQQAWEHHEPTTEHDQQQAWEHHEPTGGYGAQAGTRRRATASPAPGFPVGDAAAPPPPTEPEPGMPDRVGRATRAASTRREGEG